MPRDDMRELVRYGLLWKARAEDLTRAAAPWAGEE